MRAMSASRKAWGSRRLLAVLQRYVQSSASLSTANDYTGITKIWPEAPTIRLMFFRKHGSCVVVRCEFQTTPNQGEVR